MDRAGVRATVAEAIGLGSVPDVEGVMRRLERGLDDTPLEEYTAELAKRADDLLVEILKAMEDPEDPREATETEPVVLDRTIQALLDEIYPA